MKKAKECKYCQGFATILHKRTKNKCLIVELDCDTLIINFYDDKANSYINAQKKIKFCPMCGRKLQPYSIEEVVV